jgi:hypothetical protein
MPSTYNRMLPPRRCSDRRIRSKAFKSVFKYPPVEPEFVYFLSSAQTCAAYGISDEALATDRKSWEQNGTGNFAQPVLMDDHTWRYRRDSVVGAETGNEFIDIFKRNRAEWIAQDKLKSHTRSAAASSN